MKTEHFNKTEKKKNTQIQRSFPDTLSDKFPQITLKFATLYLFYPFLSYFFYIKCLFKNFFVCYLFESVSELESCGTYRLNLHANTPPRKHHPVKY